MDKIVIYLAEGGDEALAYDLANKIEAPVLDCPGDELTVVFDSTGVSLKG